MGLRDAAKRALDVVEDARSTVSVGAAVSVAALIIATVALIVAVTRQ